MAELTLGTVLGTRFEIVGVLGQGGMAIVYLVHDRLRDEKIALKVLHDHLANTSMRHRLRREVMAASRIRNPHALVASDLHELDGHLALTMPVHNGHTLSDYIAARGPLPIDRLEKLALHISDALCEAHRHGVVHRDVTPANVMLDEDGNAVLTDFGLARLEDLRSATATGVVGTCGYAAPEVYQGERADPRADIYSLGTILYLAATGRPPFDAPNPMGVLQRQLAEDFVPLAKARPELPSWLASTIEAMVHRDPGRRPQGARAVFEALTAREAVGGLESPDADALEPDGDGAPSAASIGASASDASRPETATTGGSTATARPAETAAGPAGTAASTVADVPTAPRPSAADRIPRGLRRVRAATAEASAGSGATDAQAAARPGATNAQAAARSGATNAQTAAQPGATNAQAAARPGATNTQAAARPGATPGVDGRSNAVPLPPDRSVASTAARPAAPPHATQPEVLTLTPFAVGNWSVVVRERRDEYSRRHWLRRRIHRKQRWERRRHAHPFETAMEQAADAVEERIRALFSVHSEYSPEERLANAVASEVSLPAGAVKVPEAVYEKRFRMVDQVDASAAERLAVTAREAGFRVEVIQRAPEVEAHGPGFNPQRLIFLIPLIIFLISALIANMLPFWIVFLIFGSATFRVFNNGRGYRGRDVDRLPLAFPHDLRPLLAERYRHLQLSAPSAAAPVLRDIAPEPVSPEPVRVTAPDAAPGKKGSPAKAARGTAVAPPVPAPAPAPKDRIQLMVERTEAQLEGLLRALSENAENLPDVMVSDLRTTLSGLSDQAHALGREARRMQGELANTDDVGATEAANRIEARLKRLQTLQRAGQTVDPKEIADLERGLEAHRRTLEAVEALEGRLTLVLARLLEIGSTATQVRRELKKEAVSGMSSVRLLEKLQQEATQAASALREVERAASRQQARTADEALRQAAYEELDRLEQPAVVAASEVTVAKLEPRAPEREDARKDGDGEKELERLRQAAQQRQRV